LAAGPSAGHDEKMGETTQYGCLRYWRNVFAHSVSRTLSFFGWNRRTAIFAIFTVLSTGLGSVLLYRLAGWSAVAEELTTAFAFGAALLICFGALFLWNFARAPDRIWASDQLRIRALEYVITPKLVIAYDAPDCYVTRIRGKHTESVSRYLWTDIKDHDHYIRLRCTNKSELPLADCKAYLVDVHMMQPNGRPTDLPYHDQLQLGWSSLDETDSEKTVVLAPEVPRHIEIVVQSGPEGIPRIPGAPFHYVRLLEIPGIYIFTIQVSAPNSARSMARMRMSWNKDNHMVQLGDVELIDRTRSPVGTARRTQPRSRRAPPWC
jgi:hypothetical protein